MMKIDAAWLVWGICVAIAGGAWLAHNVFGLPI